MRRMYSQKQLEAIAKAVAESSTTKISLAQVFTNVQNSGKPVVIDSNGKASVGKVNIVDLKVSPPLTIGVRKVIVGNNEGKFTLTDELETKTLEQSQANDVISFSAPNVVGFTKLEGEYTKCIRVNQTLKIILCARYKNDDTESSKNFVLGTAVIDNIPSSIGSKIFDLGGKNLTEVPTSANGADNIRLTTMGVNVYGHSQLNHSVRLYHRNQNQMGLYHNITVSVGASEVISITGEINLSLI